MIQLIRAYKIKPFKHWLMLDGDPLQVVNVRTSNGRVGVDTSALAFIFRPDQILTVDVADDPDPAGQPPSRPKGMARGSANSSRGRRHPRRGRNPDTPAAKAVPTLTSIWDLTFDMGPDRLA